MAMREEIEMTFALVIKFGPNDFKCRVCNAQHLTEVEVGNHDCKKENRNG